MAFTRIGYVMPEEIKNIQSVEPPAATTSPALRLLATMVSYVFHPVFMPVIMTMLLFRLSAHSYAGLNYKQYVLIYVLPMVVSTLLLPLVAMFLLRRLDFIESIQLKTSKERILPLIITMIFYFWINMLYAKRPEMALIMKVFTKGLFWGIIVLFIANIFLKVSLHTTAAGGVVGLMIVLMIMSPVSMVVPFFVSLIIAGIIGTARMLLGAHYPFEIYLGYFIGIVVQVAAYWYVS